MSLIMDALKKAQQMRLRGQNSPSFPEPTLKKAKKRKIKIYSLIFIIFLFTLATSFFIGYEILPRFTSQKKSAVISQKKEPVLSVNNIKREAISFKKMDSVAQKKEQSLAVNPSSGDGKEKKIERKKETQKVKEVTPTLPESQKKVPLLQKIDEQENTIHTYFNSGVEYYRQREFAKAIQSYKKVIELNPSYFEAYNNLGIIYQDLGDYDKASELYNKAIKVNPQYEKAYNNLGILYLITNRYDEALTAFQNALRINPNNVESNINLGTLYRRKNQFDKSIEYYKKALDINPFHGETHYNLGLVYEQSGDVNLAINHYQKFIQLSSKNHPDLVLKVKRHIEYLMSVKGEKGKNNQ